MQLLLFIACGGGVGAVMRYLVAGWGHQLVAGTFPVGTLIVNTTGCLLIGFLGATLSGPVLVREEYRMGLMVGLLGGFTTFSTFGYETLALLEDGDLAMASLNILLSNLLGLAAVWGGYRLAELWHGA